MSALKNKILDPKIRPMAIKDCVALVDNEVAAKKGVKGMVIKIGYKTFKTIRPSIVVTAVDVLMDDFAEKLDQQYDKYLAIYPDKDQPFDRWVASRDVEIANELLTVTDDLIARSNRTTIKKVYARLRKTAQKNVAYAAPAIGRLVLKYT